MVTSVNLIYSDVTTEEGYKKTFGWLKYYHWRYALLIKWMDNVGGYIFFIWLVPHHYLKLSLLSLSYSYQTEGNQRIAMHFLP